MARFSARYVWPDPAADVHQRGMADFADLLLSVTAQLGFARAGACPTGLAATGVDRTHDLKFRLVFSWARLGPAAGRGLEITAELLSNEAMAAGAPLSRACFRAVHAALLATCSDLTLNPMGHGRHRDRSLLDGLSPEGRSATPRLRDRPEGDTWLEQAA